MTEKTTEISIEAAYGAIKLKIKKDKEKLRDQKILEELCQDYPDLPHALPSNVNWAVIYKFFCFFFTDPSEQATNYREQLRIELGWKTDSTWFYPNIRTGEYIVIFPDRT